MVKSELLKQLKNMKEKSSVKVSHLLVDDANSHMIADEALAINPEIECIIAIDHDTPSGSEEAASIQKKLIKYAIENEIILYNGEGIGTGILIEKHLKAGDVVIGCEKDISAVGAIGALGFSLDVDALKAAAQDGEININVENYIFVDLIGQLKTGVSIKDVALNLYTVFKNTNLENAVILFKSKSMIMPMSLDDKITLCAHMKHLGAITCSFLDDETAFNASYTVQVILDEIMPKIVLPDNYQNVEDFTLTSRVGVSEAFIGGISGGKISDLREAAKVLKGNKLQGRTRMIVAPATSGVYIEALLEGLVEIFLDAGCIVMNQGYSADYGKSQGILIAGENMISSGMRNHKGVLGDPDGKVYIASPISVATAAINGTFSYK